MSEGPRGTITLTESDRATLLTWARGRNRGRALAQRAQILLACEREANDTAVARQLGVSRDMVAKWRARFLAEGPDGLYERPRRGRPAKVDDGTVLRILMRLLTAPPSDGKAWSTRAMAAETGLSQTTVNRIWRAYRLQSRAGRAGPTNGRTVARSTSPSTSPSTEFRDVVGLYLAPPVRVLACVADNKAPSRRRRRTGTATAPPALPRTAAAARNLFAVVDALALVRGNGDQDGASPEPSLNDFLRGLERSVPATLNVHLLAASEPNSATRDTIESWVRQHPGFHHHLVPADTSWLDEVEAILAHLPSLSHENVPGLGASLAELRDDIRVWCDAWTPHTSPFTWRGPTYNSTVSNSTQDGRLDPDAPDPDPDPDPDPVVGRVRDALLASRQPSGARVKESPLAADLGVSRGKVRNALRVLVEEGMLERLPDGAAAVPQVDVTSVLDLYAVRATLGTVLMRRVAMLNRSELRPVNSALSHVRTVARRGDSGSIGSADLQFQDAVARAAGLPQAGLFFQRLTLRLRMFIAVLKLDFADAAADLIAREDTGIFEAIGDGDGDEAARLWRIKVERSVRYMVTKVPEGHFDPTLWITIAGKPAPRPGDLRKSPATEPGSS